MRLAHAAVTALLLCAPAFAQEPDAAPTAEGALPRTPNARELRGLIKALGADDWAAREAARERLLDLGPEAVPWLERAARDPDPQRALVAQELLRSLRWRVPEDVRKTVGDALDDFPALPRDQRLKALIRCAQLGVQARAAAGFLINVARFDPDAEVRHAAVDAYLQVTVGDVPDQDRAALEALVDEKDPGASTFLLRARLLERLGRGDEAAVAAGQAYLRAPGHPRLACYVLDLLLARGDLDRATAVAADAEARSPDDLAVRARAGEALARAGDLDDGLARLASVVAAEGALDDPELLLRVGQAYLRCERVAEAEQVFRSSLGRFPYNRELNVALADVFLAAGRRREAVEIYLSEVRYATPGTAGFQGLRERLGALLREGGAARLADEDAFYDDARRGRPVVAVRRAVAAWLSARRLHEEAAEELRAACALAPGDAALRVALGDCLRDQGDLPAAKAAYEQAAALDARSHGSARLRDLAGLAARPPAAEEATGFSSWEWRAGAETLGKTTEAVTDDAPPPPLVLRDRVVVPLAGATDLFGLDAADGALLWRFTPEPPPFEGEALPEQVGLELLALVEAPAAAVAALDPRRARTGAPVVVALYNAFWRPLHRTWRAARFTGLHAYVLDPSTGALLGRRDLDARAQVVAPAPVARRGRVLAFASPRAKRVVLELVDLVAGRPLWQAGLPYVAMRRPLFADDRLLVAWDAGVVALGEDGERRWSYEHGDGSQLSTDLARCGDGVLVGTSDGRLLRLALDGGAPTELARPGPERLTGEVVVAGARAFVAARGGAVHALDLAPDLAQVTSRAWTLAGPRAAARSLTWAGDLLFALNGSDDAFADEAPLVLAIDPASGQVLLQRPVDRPATLAGGQGLVVVAAGGRQSRLGLKVLGVRSRERLDPRAAKLAALSAAARDALHEGQFEVSAVVARMVVAAAGGLDALPPEALATVARTLARSKREEEALDLIHQGEERAGKDEAAQALWGEVRRELGFEGR
ncbi:MAG: PQQ-binding-like beta-propeller repeat protein [Planctomycetes bacterium]|nr:PQQ-binding-like beta-propeller repeat protein [Planctomycetota bacterium]